MDAGEQSGYGTLSDQIEGGTATDTALSAEDKQKVAVEPVPKFISEGLSQVAVFRGPPESAHLVPHHQRHESEGRQREVRPGSSGGQRSRTPTNARRSITQAGDKKGGQQSLTSWLRPKTPSTVQSSTGDSGGGQRLSTSWMRPKSSPAPAVYAAPAPVVEYIPPDPAGSYAEPAPVAEYISTVPGRTSSIGGVRESPAVNIDEPAPTVCTAHDTVVECISPATAMSIAAPTPVQFATPVEHALPEHCAMASSADTQPSFAPTAPEIL